MNYWEFFKGSCGSRDIIFQDILSHFKGPTKILEIGTTRNLKSSTRNSDGWSSFHWLDHVVKHGGFVDIVDIDPTNITSCADMLGTRFEDPKKLKEYVGFYCRDGANFLQYALCYNKYDLYFLDSSDKPEDTYNQFILIPSGSKILIDDFHTKGEIVRKYFPEFRRYWFWIQLAPWDKYYPEMAAYGFENKDIQCHLVR